MKHIGSILKKHIEDNRLVKKNIAESVGITYNYLSTIFKKDNIDCELLERFCRVLHISPMMFFELEETSEYNYKSNNTIRVQKGNAELHIDSHNGDREALLAEKERVIQTQAETISVLRQMVAMNKPEEKGTKTGQVP